MSAFWVWLRFASVERNEPEVRSRPGGARPQGLAWSGSPRLAYHLVPQNEAMLLMPPLCRSANAACLAVTALATATRHCVLFDDMWSIANRHSSVQVFVHDHSLSGQSVPSAGFFQLKHSIVQGNDVVLFTVRSCSTPKIQSRSLRRRRTSALPFWAAGTVNFRLNSAMG